MQETYATQIQTGTDVYGSDDEKIGSVAGVAQNHFVIEKGFIFTTDIYVPMSAVTSVDDDRVTLSLTKEQVEDADWADEPDEDHDHDGTYAGGTATMEGGTHETADAHSGTEGDVPVTREEVSIERRSVDRPAGGEAFTEDSIDVPVYEERVQTGKEARVVEELEVGKTSVTDTERVEETVRREEFDIDDETGTSRQTRGDHS